MAFSSKARKFMQIWAVLAGLMFFVQCADRARPMLDVILKKQKAATAPQ